ncbi:MAG: hypothetical protein DRN30_06090, partial [Thermoplasmata archaeon]
MTTQAEEQAQSSLRRHSEILEMIATGKSTSSIYNAIALMYEPRHIGLRCSLLELKGNKLKHGGAPSLPKEYCDAVNGLQVGPSVGSCGTSTYTGKRVLVENIETDPKWAEIKHIALPHGMRCCWSEPIKDSKGEVLGAFGMYYDYPALPNADELDDLQSAARLSGIIMERDQRETALHQSENKYRTLVENLPQRLYLMDKNSVYISCSNNFAEDLGIKPEQIVGTTDYDYFSKADAENYQHNDRRIIQSGSPEEIEKTIIINGEEKIIHTIKTPVLDEKGNVDGVLGILLDVTQQRRLEKKYYQAQKMESLGLLASGVAHDLNNILSGIVSYPDLLLIDLPEESPLRNPIETIRSSGLRAAAVVADLLAIARGVAVVKEPVNMNALIEDYLSATEFEELKRIYPTVITNLSLDADLLHISGSNTHFRKVIMNLVSNAFEATKHDGDILISTRNRYVDKAIQGYEDVKAGEYTIFSVSDNGPGISQEDLGKIFEPFYSKKIMGRSGTGLGLTVVWNVVQDFNGYIEVKSDENGTTFELYFPAIREEVKGEESLGIEGYKGNGETILIVDDQANQREIASAIISKIGYKAVAVDSGEKAVEYLNRHTVDLVLLDMIMDPGINGLETYKRIIEIHPGQKAIIA